ncbi:MAG: hypothetical protein ACR2QK_19650 [Acidimicrobiales bacterium]
MTGIVDRDDHASVSTQSVVSKGGRGSSAAAVVAGLVVAGIIGWLAIISARPQPPEEQLVSDGGAEAGVGPEVQLARPGPPATVRTALLGPSPTVRWETPPKFGGRGDSSVNSERPEPEIRRGRYR